MIFSEIVILSFKSCAFATRVCDTRSLLLFLVCILLVVISVWKHLCNIFKCQDKRGNIFKKKCSVVWELLVLPPQTCSFTNIKSSKFKSKPKPVGCCVNHPKLRFPTF